MTAISELIDLHLARDPEQLFLTTEHAQLTYGELGTWVRRLQLRLFPELAGSKEVVVVCVRDDASAIACVLALLKSGLPALVLDGASTLASIERTMAYANAAVLITDHEDAVRQRETLPKATRIVDPRGRGGLETPEGQCRELSLPAESDTALIVMTSGTTSEPKGVELTYANLAAQIELFREVYGFDSATRMLNALPLHHVDGLIRGAIVSVAVGGTLFRDVSLHPGGLARLAESVRQNNITHLVVVPVVLDWLMHVPAFVTAAREVSLDSVISSADYLDPVVWQHAVDALGVPVYNAYGLSELVCDALFATRPEQMGTVGVPFEGEARVVDSAGREVPDGETGELCFRGKLVMKGYLNRPESTSEVLRDGWFYTGDLFRKTPSGWFEFRGRKKNIVVRGGATIYPNDVVSCLTQHPDVTGAIVFGVSDASRGEKLVACVTAQGCEVSQQGMLQYCRANLPPEIVPDEIHVVEELPRTSAGKINLESVRKIHRFASVSDEQIPSLVRTIAAECFGVEASVLNDESNIYNTEGWDSLSHLNLIEALESHFGITFEPEDILELDSIEEAIRLVRQYR